MRIAITGGIGSGKSTVAAYVSSLGYRVLDADKIASDLTCRAEVLNEIAKDFPTCVENGRLNRKALASIVFADDAALKKLNAVLHKRVMDEIAAAKGDVIFAEVPLLFEGGFVGNFDKVIVITRDRNARIEAVKKRSGLSDAQVEARMKNQIDYEKYDFSGCEVIRNDGDEKTLQEATRRVLKSLGLKV